MDESRLKTLRADSVAVLVKVAALEFEKLAGRELADFGLTTSQFKALQLILNEPEPTVRQVDIERAFAMTNPTVTGIVQNLEKSGLVKRVPNPSDARSKVIVPTEKALSMKEDLFAAGKRVDGEFTQTLTAAEHRQLLNLLSKLVDA